MRKTFLTALGLVHYLLMLPAIDRVGAQHRLMVADPGHFHAALVQKMSHPGIDRSVYVYAEKEADLADYLAKIQDYNNRSETPASWKEEVYTGSDFLEKMLADKSGDIVVLAGNNRKKIRYIEESVRAGLNVLADKPMVIDDKGFDVLKEVFSISQKKGIVLYDIMTARYNIVNILQRELSLIPAIFGELEKGTPENPAVVSESKHHFFKNVSGKPLKRPDWFFDVEQQGAGIVDVGTHLVDQIQWSCFPNVKLDYQKDVILISSKISATSLTLDQFYAVTGSAVFPAFPDTAISDSLLHVYSNGVINYKLKGIHARVGVHWDFQAAAGEGDTHYSRMRGSRANLVIRQGAAQQFKPVLSIETPEGKTINEKVLRNHFRAISDRYPGVGLQKDGNGWIVTVPASYYHDHEESFARVVNQYLGFLKDGTLPDWEVPNMIAKYYTLTQALKNALKEKPGY